MSDMSFKRVMVMTVTMVSIYLLSLLQLEQSVFEHGTYEYMILSMLGVITSAICGIYVGIAIGDKS